MDCTFRYPCSVVLMSQIDRQTDSSKLLNPSCAYNVRAWGNKLEGIHTDKLLLRTCTVFAHSPQAVCAEVEWVGLQGLGVHTERQGARRVCWKEVSGSFGAALYDFCFFKLFSIGCIGLIHDFCFL